MTRICINLIFEDAVEEAIRALWSRVANTGLFVGGLHGYRPHITLSVYEVGQLSLYTPILDRIVSTVTAFPVLLESLGLFPEQGVIFLAPRMSHALFSLHCTIIQVFTEHKEALLVDDLLLPDRWTPHVTLAGQLTPPQVLQGLEACQRSWSPIRGSAVGIGIRVYPDLTDYWYASFG